jgi:hypothetical protein
VPGRIEVTVSIGRAKVIVRLSVVSSGEPIAGLNVTGNAGALVNGV